MAGGVSPTGVGWPSTTPGAGGVAVGAPSPGIAAGAAGSFIAAGVFVSAGELEGATPGVRSSPPEHAAASVLPKKIKEAFANLSFPMINIPA
jgi:hypothetical protein